MEGGPRAPLRHLLAHLDRRADRGDRRDRIQDLRVRVVGRLEHDELHDLLPACEAQVVPSTFPEAFGMVAAEGAACGVLPISAGALRPGRGQRAARRGGAARGRALAVLPRRRRRGPRLADRIASWLEAPEDLRRRTREALVATARERFSWDGVARDAIAAAEGRLDDLRPPRG